MTRRLRKRHISGIIGGIIVLLLALGQSEGWFSSTKQGTVTTQPGLYAIDHYVDGDTIAVTINGKAESIRMIGVDTPETHKPNAPVQCYGPAAAAYTQNRIKSTGGTVRIASDSLGTDRDRYKRLLRYVYLTDGTNLDQELVTKGYGFAYVSFPFTQSDAFSAAQKNAQAKKLGLWGNCHPYQESSGRWQSDNQP